MRVGLVTSGALGFWDIGFDEEGGYAWGVLGGGPGAGCSVTEGGGGLRGAGG